MQNNNKEFPYKGKQFRPKQNKQTKNSTNLNKAVEMIYAN